MDEQVDDDLRAVVRLPPEYYGALMSFCQTKEILPDLVRKLAEKAGTLIINLCIYGPDHIASFSLLRLRPDELMILSEHLDENSEMGKLVIESLQTINVYKVTKEIENGMSPDDGRD